MSYTTRYDSTTTDTANAGTYYVFDWGKWSENSEVGIVRLSGEKMEDKMYLWEIWVIYTGDIGCPIVKVPVCGYTVAKDAEEAKLKSGAYKLVEDDWDKDYVTVMTKQICEVRVPKKKDK